MRFLRPRLWAALMLAATLASCGGDRSSEPEVTGALALRAALHSASRSAPARSPGPMALSAAKVELRKTALAASVSAQASDLEALDAAEQLMEFAQASYPQYFPGQAHTELFEGYLYRHYLATGVYLGVRDGNVYLLGGPFGDTVQSIGPLTQFITPAAAQRDPCTRPGTAYGVHATVLPALGRSAGAVLAGCNGPIGSPRWQQTAGPTVALLSHRTQAISFDPSEAGQYRFEVSFTNPQGLPRTETVTINIPAAATPALGITSRVHQAVRSGASVSLRAWPRLPAGEVLKAVRWRQLEGPAVTFDTDTQDDHLATFKAPTVTRDTLLRLRATVETQSGLTASDDVLVVVEIHAQVGTNSNAIWTRDPVSRTYPFRDTSPFTPDLVRCVYDAGQIGSGAGANLCTLSRMPFLAQSGDLPTVDQVMDKVLVSHDWMGRNFEALLRTHDGSGDIRRMLRSVTAIVIGSHVRPSFYMPATGAIYLDAENFWLIAEERDTLNEAPDYRSSFGKALKYGNLWRYVKDGRDIFRYHNPRERASRTLEDVQLDAFPLLYHELGHALDFLPPADYALLDSRLSAWANMAPRFSRFGNPSDRVTSLFPLMATEMYALADVNYKGETATEVQKAYTAEQVAGFFAADRATDPYAYSAPTEDAAMLLEEFLMRHRLGIARDVAFSEPVKDEDTGATIVVRWGQRGRAGEAALRERTKEVVRQLTPWIDADEVDKLPAPLPLRAGESWRDNLRSTPTPASERRRNLAFKPSEQEQREFRQQLLRMQRQR